MSLPTRESPAGKPRAKRPFQFGIRDLLLWTTAICIVLGVGLAWGLLPGYLAFSACVLLGMFYYAAPPRKAIVGYWVASAVLLLVFVVFILPALDYQRTPSLGSACRSRTWQIALAIANYEAAHGKFPPAYTVDATGRRLHSWRTLLLPYLEHKNLYDQLDLDIPWNAPANWGVTDQCLSMYQCPAHPRYSQGSFTSYVAIVGPETMWPGEQSRRQREVTDGPASTILVIEIASTNIAWAEPRDLTVDEILAAYDTGDVTGMASYHPGDIALTAFADGHELPIDMQTIDRATLRAMLTVAGGEIYHQGSLETPPSYIPPPEPEPAPKDDDKPPTNTATRATLEPESSP